MNKMIFEIDSSFNKLEDWSHYEQPLHELFEAHRTGRHMVVASRDILSKIISTAHLGTTLNNCIKQIFQKYSDMNSILNTATKAILIYDYAITKEQPNKPNRIPVEIGYALVENALEKFSLVVEHSKYDGDLIKLFAEPVATHIKLPPTSFDLNFSHGGGSSIGEVIKSFRDKGAPFFAISDSDKDFPGATPRGTSKNVIEAMTGFTSPYMPLVGYGILHVREIENLIPIEGLEEIFDSSNHARIFQELRKLVPKWPDCSSEEREIWAHLDLKNGKDLSCGQSAAEINHYKTIEIRMGKSSYSGISSELGKTVCNYCADERAAASIKKIIRNILPKSPFWDEIKDTLADLISASVRNPYRV